MPKKLTLEEAQEELKRLRSGRGGRTSKYAEYLEAAEEMGKGDVITDTLDGYNKVTSLRNYIDRTQPDKYVVKSARHSDDADKDQSDARYKVFIFRAEDVDE